MEGKRGEGEGKRGEGKKKERERREGKEWRGRGKGREGKGREGKGGEGKGGKRVCEGVVLCCVGYEALSTTRYILILLLRPSHPCLVLFPQGGCEFMLFFSLGLVYIFFRLSFNLFFKLFLSFIF